MDLSISNVFVRYLTELAPSLFYDCNLDAISFRWKIPQQECLRGWTSKKSGIDIVEELRTSEMCGFIGVHFPGKAFMRAVMAQDPGPYRPSMIVKSLQEFLQANEASLGKYYEEIFAKAQEADAQGCVMRYANRDTKEPLVLTAQHSGIFYGANNS